MANWLYVGYGYVNINPLPIEKLVTVLPRKGTNSDAPPPLADSYVAPMQKALENIRSNHPCGVGSSLAGLICNPVVVSGSDARIVK